jgi:hypothetical protein
MRFLLGASRAAAVCNETRTRRYGYQLRCLEPQDHDGAHRWTPELVPDGGSTRPPRGGPPNGNPWKARR